MPEINYWAVIVSALSSIVIGSIWFGPLFGTTFMKGVGMDKWDDAKKTAMKKAMPLTYIKQLILSLLMAYLVASLLSVLRTISFDSPTEFIFTGLRTSFWLWLGIAVPVRYGESLWNGQEFKYTTIDLGYWLVLLMVYGAILSTWI